MLTGKTITTFGILERIYRTSGFTQYLKVADAVELIGEAIDLIGAPVAFITKITDGNTDAGHPPPIVIEDYKGLLPPDLKEIIQTRTFDKKIPIRYSQDTFHNSFHCEGSPDLYCKSDLTYKLSQNLIKPSFKEGKVEMAYRAYYLDEYGMPLIPAEERYVKGVEAYVKFMLYKPLWELGKIRDAVYQAAEQEYLFYMGSAVNQAHLLNLDQAMGVKNMMIRLIPDVMAFENFFKSEGKYPGVYNHNNLGS